MMIYEISQRFWWGEIFWVGSSISVWWKILVACFAYPILSLFTLLVIGKFKNNLQVAITSITQKISKICQSIVVSKSHMLQSFFVSLVIAQDSLQRNCVGFFYLGFQRVIQVD